MYYFFLSLLIFDLVFYGGSGCVFFSVLVVTVSFSVNQIWLFCELAESSIPDLEQKQRNKPFSFLKICFLLSYYVSCSHVLMWARNRPQED